LEGLTDTERWLINLAKKSFLSLWSFPNVYRDSRPNSSNGNDSSDGKEICDLLIAFDNNVLVFSDKSCEYKIHYDPMVAWRRWYGSAIHKSYKQAYAAEKWVKNHSDRIFLDRKCTKQIHLPLDNTRPISYFKILVCHNVRSATKLHYGAENGIKLDTRIHESHHLNSPFHVGVIDDNGGYAHIFETESIEFALSSLSTTSDFVHYLSLKQEILDSGRNFIATSEKDIIGSYFFNINEAGQHFLTNCSDQTIAFAEGTWEKWTESIQYISKTASDNENMIVDSLIEYVTENWRLGGVTSKYSTAETTELILRALASEDRFGRRFLSKAIKSTLLQKDACNTRFVPASTWGKTHYLILAVDPTSGENYDDYRAKRKDLLECHCLMHRHLKPDSLPIIGFATETAFKLHEGRTEEFYYCAGYDSLPSHFKELAKTIAEGYVDNGFAKNRCELNVHEDEYPATNQTKWDSEKNGSCPCGSGKLFRYCCGTQSDNLSPFV